MARHQGAYTPPGGPRKKLASGAKSKGASSVIMLHGYPYLAHGERAGDILISPQHFHPSFGLLETMDAHWGGKAWKIALAKPAESCPDCHGVVCSLCGGHGSIIIRAGNTMDDKLARPPASRNVGYHQDDLALALEGNPEELQAAGMKLLPEQEDQPGDAERKCPACLGKKCSTCGDKGEIVPIVWILRSSLKPVGKPQPLKPGNTNQAKHVMVGAIETRDRNNRYENIRAEVASRGL